jgi:hypothetical protein
VFETSSDTQQTFKLKQYSTVPAVEKYWPKNVIKHCKTIMLLLKLSRRWIRKVWLSSLKRRFGRTYCLHLYGRNCVKHETMRSTLTTIKKPGETVLFFDPKVGGRMFLRNVEISPKYTVLQPRTNSRFIIEIFLRIAAPMTVSFTVFRILVVLI